MKNETRIYAGIEGDFCKEENANIILRSIPFDGTSTWGKGADKGFDAFMNASDNMEIYDIETNSEVYKQGVFVSKELAGHQTAEAMFEETYADTRRLLETGKFITTFGGEHSVSIGIIKAFYEKFDNLTVLQIDAHTDLRPSYMGTPYNHACAVYDASQNCNLVQVGIRSMDGDEMQYVNQDKCFFMHEMQKNANWQEEVIAQMTENIYITFDLDAFDPAICPGTGTPEPGGMQWYETLQFLHKVFEQKNVVGFDIVELAPIKGQKVSEFLAAKLYYKMLTYKFEI